MGILALLLQAFWDGDGEILETEIPNLCAYLNLREKKLRAVLGLAVECEFISKHDRGWTCENVAKQKSNLIQNRINWKLRQDKHRNKLEKVKSVTRDKSVTDVNTYTSSLLKDPYINKRDPEDLIPSKAKGVLGGAEPEIQKDLKPTEEIQTEQQDEYTGLAESRLQKYDEALGWVRDNRYLATGRRPMRLYADLWLTTDELAEVFRSWDAAGISRERWKEMLMLADGKAKAWRASGKPTIGMCAFSWLIGWVKEQTVQGLISEAKKKKFEGPFLSKN